MELFLIVVGCLILSVVAKGIIYFLTADDFDEERPWGSVFNMVMVMLVTSMIPFVLGCYVGMNYIKGA